MIYIYARNGGFQIGYLQPTLAFFYSIAHNLEDHNWGSKYPVIMNELYNEGIEPEHLEQGLKEIKEIREKFKEFSPKQIVWDYDDLTITPPWIDDIPEDVTNLSQCFYSPEGRDVFDVIIDMMSFGLQFQYKVHFESVNENDIQELDIADLIRDVYEP